MESLTELLDYKLKIDLELAKFFAGIHLEYDQLSTFTTSFIKNLQEFTMRGGKRLRPALLYHSYRMFNKTNLEKVQKLSIFIELIQSFLLIHDDIMDKSELRRGDITIHKLYGQFATENNYQDKENFGNSMGILLGDLANQLAIQIITNSEFEDSKKLQLLGLIFKEISAVIFGQAHDILYSLRTDYTIEDIMFVHYYKTAKYTYEIPIISGAMLAGASVNQLNILRKYSKSAGIAFQIHDDILGIFGDDEITGKPTLSDISEGKHTLLTFIANQKANVEDKKILKEYIGKKDITHIEAEQIKKIIVNTGSLEYSTIKAQEYVKLAQDSLVELKNEINNEVSWQFISDMAKYAVSRNI